MLMASSGFVCICPQKSVELGSDAKLHRADHQEELRAELEFDAPRASTSTYASMQGGGVRALNPNSSMTLSESETCIAVFKGSLTNRELLAAGLMTGGQTILTAELLIKLYEAHGLDMLGRLDGSFAFCLYDSKQARVLAARDPSGAVPLVEGRTAKGSLIIACGTFMPEGVEDVKEIGAGQYKYGWHALPRDYAVGVARQPAARASLDHGIRRRSIDAYRAPVRQSLDGCLPRYTPPITRRHSEGGTYTPPTTRRHSEGGGPISCHSSASRRRSEDGHGHHAPVTPKPQQAGGNRTAAAAAGASGVYVPPCKQAAAVAAVGVAGQHSKVAGLHQQAAAKGQQEQAQKHHQPAHHPATQQVWRPKQAPAAEGLSIALPAAATTTPGDNSSQAAATAPATPVGSVAKPNRRRHRRGRGSGKGGAGASGSPGAGHSDTESSHSSSTASSASHEHSQASSRSGGRQRHASASAATTAGAARRSNVGPAVAAAAPVVSVMEVVAPVMGFKRNSSCGDLLAAAGAPTGPLPGMAC